jgi:hypothetical protein
LPVLAGIGDALVHSLAAVHPVLEQLIEPSLIDGLTGGASDARGIELPCQYCCRVAREEPLEDHSDDGSLALLEEELSVLDPEPNGTVPPIHMPFFREPRNLSLMRSPITSHSNCAKESRMLSVSLPLGVPSAATTPGWRAIRGHRLV